jgi:hypothetical protein
MSTGGLVGLAVSTGELVGLAVSTGELVGLAVSTGELVGLAVSTGELVGLAVSTGELVGLAVSTGGLVGLAMGTAGLVALAQDADRSVVTPMGLAKAEAMRLVANKRVAKSRIMQYCSGCKTEKRKRVTVPRKSVDKTAKKTGVEKMRRRMSDSDMQQSKAVLIAHEQRFHRRAL